MISKSVSPISPGLLVAILILAVSMFNFDSCSAKQSQTSSVQPVPEK